jgi:hypothetical protein
MLVVVLPGVSFSVLAFCFFQGPIVITPLSPVIIPFSHHPPQYGWINPVKNGFNRVILVLIG